MHLLARRRIRFFVSVVVLCLVCLVAWGLVLIQPIEDGPLLALACSLGNACEPPLPPGLYECTRSGGTFGLATIPREPDGQLRAWSNPHNAEVSDDQFATVSLMGAYQSVPGYTSEYLQATNFGCHVPRYARISGIVLEVEGLHYPNPAGQCGSVLNPGRLCPTDKYVRLVKRGVISGADRHSGNFWISDAPQPQKAIHVYGSASDLWDQHWTPADVNAVDFGAVIAFWNLGNSRGEAAAIDSMKITVHYAVTAAR